MARTQLGTIQRGDGTPFRVLATTRAEAVIRDHGGRIWIWASREGFVHVSLNWPTRPELEFDEFDVAGVRLFFATDIASPDVLRLVGTLSPRNPVAVRWQPPRSGTWLPPVA